MVVTSSGYTSATSSASTPMEAAPASSPPDGPPAGRARSSRQRNDTARSLPTASSGSASAAIPVLRRASERLQKLKAQDAPLTSSRSHTETLRTPGGPDLLPTIMSVL